MAPDRAAGYARAPRRTPDAARPRGRIGAGRTDGEDMGFVDFLYAAPVWQMGCIVSAIAIGGTTFSMFLIDRLWPKERRRLHNDIAGFLIAVVGIVYAILISSLAITVLARKDRAENLVYEEADRLAALEREVVVLPQDVRPAIRAEIGAYLDAVIDREWPQMHRAERPDAGEGALAALWRAVAALPMTNLAEMTGAQELRRHIDRLYEMRRGRSDLATSGVDPVVWTVVLLGSVATVVFAVMFGVENFVAHLFMSCLLAFSIALAMTMIVALDWPYYGPDSVPSQPLIDLRANLDWHS
ncbi:DUF4239 domain-containing protein [Methylobacterium sp. NEAU 140]|uniref:bestrophin-like domain n=1 Tax=Methylobacterium sp. NEAU 140 TaxID=3064945 RepID=UPI002734F1AF|nr:DUF4239 domain-containing protein [Methylobacterium sp. NEAU 140]MDP4022528.1 DUF4239 domain-containing protein [Methylobacterium sp. NEAU 140]